MHLVLPCYYEKYTTRGLLILVVLVIGRVRDLICTRAGIKKVPWDGYLKYHRPSPKLTEKM